MDIREDIFNEIYDSFKNMGGRFHILEQRVPVELQMDYFNYARRIRTKPRELDDRAFRRYKEKLENIELPTEEKKKILSLLATSKEIRAFRLLEHYNQHPDKELKNWAYMALMESRIMVESELTDEKQIFISTGLGGKEEKLRFYVLIVASKGVTFVEYQRKIIEKEFGYLLPKHEYEIERLTIGDRHVELVILTPFISRIKQIFENAISECNQYGNFLSGNVVITNVKELDQDEIGKILQMYENE